MKYLVLAVLFAACTTPTSVSSPTPTKGKPTAPVEVTALLKERSAQLELKFESDAKDVKVAVSGVDGLVVEGPSLLLESGTFARGELRKFEVKFTPGEGRSQLVVSISGTFNGASRARVAAFGVGSGPLPQSPGTVIQTDDGERVKVMPASPP